MRRSAGLTEKSTNIENEAQIEPKVKKYLSDISTSKIATFDNGTMVESFKYLNYWQLANSSHVSKRFRDLIQNHRHLLALLFIDHIGIRCFLDIPTYIKMFDEELSPEDYSEWVVRNHYSKQTPLDAGKQRRVNVRSVYRFRAEAVCKDFDFKITVFSAQTKLNDETWPLFQHFVRLLADPFIYIRYMELTPQKELLNLLTGAINPDRGRLYCGELKYNFDGKNKKFLNWTKTHVRCNELKIYLYTSSNFDKLFLDLFMTGAHFSPNFVILGHLFNGVAAFVQKFIGLKNCDTSLMVDSIRCRVPEFTADAFKSNYEKFFVKEEENDLTTAHVFEFVNADIGKKLQLTSTGLMIHELYPQVILEVINL